MTNTTEYARYYGYTGKDVWVYDGKVVSHRNQDWFEFMQKVRTDARKRNDENTKSSH